MVTAPTSSEYRTRLTGLLDLVRMLWLKLLPPQMLYHLYEMVGCQERLVKGSARLWLVGLC